MRPNICRGKGGEVAAAPTHKGESAKGVGREGREGEEGGEGLLPVQWRTGE